jgi:L-asparaginase II
VDPILVEVMRGGLAEARHRVHAVAVRGGEVVVSAGDPMLVTHFRSAAKPLQVLPVVRARPDLEEREIAIACASHLARPDQLDAVRSLLAKAQATEDDLECGAASDAGPTRIEHNCSGKHAGFIALCKAEGWPVEGYRLPDHPCQRMLLDEVSVAAMVDPDGIPTGVDGCGVVTFALPLARMALAFSRIASSEGAAATAAAAMRAHPDLIRGPGAPDTELMRALPGWIAKGGAEGVLCAASPDGLGIALKVEDGSGRALRSGLGAFLRRLGLEPGDLGVVRVENSRGEPVGEHRAV